MIGRLWFGTVAADQADDYARHIREAVLPELQRTDGFGGVYVLRRPVEKGVAFAVLTLWDSMEAVRGFAGPNPEQAVVTPAARALMVEFDKTVAHYELALESLPGK
jgi:heme-degrading monooxygenase HmoA